MKQVAGALTVLALAAVNAPAPRWELQKSGVTARLRGVSAASDTVAWASGAGGTILRTADGGNTWSKLSVPDADKLDFRDIDAVNETTAYILSIGAGAASRIYKTTDAGAHWTLQFTSEDAQAFFDAMAFWDAQHGIAMSDSVDGHFVIITTEDGGAAWTRVPADRLPPALLNEGGFAGSGTNIAVMNGDHAWVGTGAAATARVLVTADASRSWHIVDTPIASSASSGIFSVAFRDLQHGVAVGGDYRREADAIDNAARTDNGGLTWTAIKGLGGFRSVVASVPGSTAWITVGPQGADWSDDDGRTWTPIAGDGYHAFAFAPSGHVGWGVGENGRIGALRR